MIPVLSEYEARKLDEVTIQSGFRSGAELMDKAGHAVAYHFIEHVEDPFSQKVLVIAGKGNNGGDGIVCHSTLLESGVQSTLLLMSDSELDRDLISEYRIPRNTIRIYGEKILYESFDWMVDALFGIGLQRDITGVYAEIVSRMNGPSNLLSIDIPSGIYTDTGMAAGCAASADMTVTMGYTKLGHHLNQGLECTGNLTAVRIGFKPLGPDMITATQVTKEDVASRIAPHSLDAYKYSRGRIGVLGGSRGMTGAGILSCRAAYRSGGGIVYALIPESLNTVYESSLTETLTNPLNDHSRGYLDQSVASDAVEFCRKMDVLICGPGISQTEGSQLLLTEVLRNFQGKLVLDASGFSPLWTGKLKISDLPARSVLTPHVMEFSRLFGMTVEAVKANPVKACRKIQPLLDGRVLILKGAPSLIVSSDPVIRLMNHGSPILATAGTGDVLSGILGGLMGQGLTPDDAAIAGSWIHADAAVLFNELSGCRGMTAGDLTEYLPLVFDEL